MARTKKASQITDRAKRYRARRNAPAESKRCYFCGRPNPSDVEHIDGNEANDDPTNLAWSCRSCNTTKGAHFAAKGRGIRTRQFNPSKKKSGSGAKSLSQYLTAVMTLKGQSDAMSLTDAINLVHNTPAADRSKFAGEIWSKRKARATNPQPKSRQRRRNGDEASEAAALSEAFHGRPVKRVTGYELSEKYQNNLANLGRLLRLDVVTDDEEAIRLEFHTNVRVMSSPNGRQLYFVGGKQKLNVEETGKDLVTIGFVSEIEYHTSKDFHDFEPVDYSHEFGEESGVLPTLLYDALNQRMLLSGGAYRVERPGIID
jgi:hypothetical protein